MAMIVYGWGDVFHKKKFMGYGYCERCGGFEQYYLSHLVFRVHICYIPVFMRPKGYYITCKGCDFGHSITKEDYKRYKSEYKAMSKSMSKKCWKEICRLCDMLKEYSPSNVDYVMSQISAGFPVNTSEVLRQHYQQLVNDRLQSVSALYSPVRPASAAAAVPAGAAAAATMPTVTMPTVTMPNAVVPAAAGPAWTCPCGAVNSDRFCSDCGKPMPVRESASEPEKLTVCPRCGKDNGSAPFFCSVCGAPMNKKQ